MINLNKAIALIILLVVKSASAESIVSVDSVTSENLAIKEQFNATIHSKSYSVLTAGLDARLDWIIEPGIEVEKGQLLARFDIEPLKLMAAEQKAEIERGSIHMAYLSSELNRLKRLSASDAVSLKEFERVQNEFHLAEADLKISTTKLDQIQEKIDRSNVLSPFDGVVSERFITAGPELSKGERLLRIMDLKNLEARFQVQVKLVNGVRLGSKVTVQDRLGEEFELDVSNKLPRIDQRTQSFEVRVGIPENLSKHWSVGELITVSITPSYQSAMLTIHRDAILLEQSGTFVAKINEENFVEKLPVKVGLGDKDRVFVEGKLNAGDKVATRGAAYLKHGDKVSLSN